MNFFCKKLVVLLLAALPVLTYAQISSIPVRNAIVTLDGDENGAVNDIMEVFNCPREGQNHYYLSVGHLGVGDEIIQVNVDPLFELFIPLGDTLEEAQETLKKLQDLCKASPGTTIEMPGNLAFGFPDDKLETVTVTSRKVLFGRQLEFSVERDGYTRATYREKSEINTMASGVKFHRKLHKNEP